MNRSEDVVVYSYVLSSEQLPVSTEFVHVIPGAVDASSQSIRVVENIQLCPPNKPLPCEVSSQYYAASGLNPSATLLAQAEEGTAPISNSSESILPNPPEENHKLKPTPVRTSAKLEQIEKIKPPSDHASSVSAISTPKVPGTNLKKGFIYECDICDSRFLSGTSLKLHKTGHRYAAPEKKNPWICRFCGRHFSHQQTMNDHEMVHIDEVRYDCEACGAKYSSKSGLRNHLAKNESCDESFRNRKLLRKKEEEDEKQHGCDVCGKKYRHRKSLLEHRSLHYKGEQNKCGRCGAMFETMGGWRKHTASGRCEFSRSKFKDSGGDDSGEGVFIPEDRRKFLEQVKQLEEKRERSSAGGPTSVPVECHSDEGKSMNEVATDAEADPNDYLPTEIEIEMEAFDVQSTEIKEEPTSSDESNEANSGSFVEEDPKSPKTHTPENQSPKTDVSEEAGSTPTEKNLKEKKSPKKSRPKKPRQSKVHQCPTCNKIFARSFVLKNHMRTHTGERPFLCDTCSKSFRDLASLKGHLVIHTGEKPFPCSECPARFARKSGLRNHITAHFRLPCDECDQMFPSRKTLMRHKIKHQGIRPFLCDICSKDFRTKADIQAHQRIHSNEKRYACPICAARFNCPSTLRRHRNVHAPPETRPVCESCGKSFSSQQALRKHENIHKNLKPFQCDVCAKCFRVKDHLRIHQRSHSGEKPFPCEVCPKRFATNGDLRVHMRRHTGEKPYSCDECGEAFVVTAGLYRHWQQTGHRNSKPEAIIVPDVKRAT